MRRSRQPTGHRTGGSARHEAMFSLIATLLIVAGVLLLAGLVLAARSLDGGGSWTRLPLQADFAAVAFDPLNAGVLLSVDTQGRVFRSEDRGLTWRNG